MSSILKALKKLEKETAKPDGQTWPSQLVGTEAIYRRARRKRLLNRGVAFFSVLLVAGLVGGYIYISKTPENGHAPIGKESKPVVFETPRSVAEPVQIKAAAPSQTMPGGNSGRRTPQKDAAKPTFQPSLPAPKMAGTQPTPQTGAADRGAKSGLSAVSSRIVGDLPTERSKPMAGDQAVAVPRSASLPKAVTPKATSLNAANEPKPSEGKQPAASTAKAPARAKLLKDSRLKLQAIAWSGIPQDRMAVINGQIVREGSTVDGFSITTIGPDEVIVREKNQQWRLEFSLK